MNFLVPRQIQSNVMDQQRRLTAQTTTLAHLIYDEHAQFKISCARSMPHSFDRKVWNAARRGLCRRYAQLDTKNKREKL